MKLCEFLIQQEEEAAFPNFNDFHIVPSLSSMFSMKVRHLDCFLGFLKESGCVVIKMPSYMKASPIVSLNIISDIETLGNLNLHIWNLNLFSSSKIIKVLALSTMYILNIHIEYTY